VDGRRERNMSDSDDSDSDYASEYATDEEEQLKRSKAKEKAAAAAEAEGGGDEDGAPKHAGDSAAPSSGAMKPGGTQLTESTAPISAIDKRMLEELLLVVQNLGTVDEDGNFIRGPECLNWLQDLQQVLARELASRLATSFAEGLEEAGLTRRLKPGRLEPEGVALHRIELLQHCLQVNH
jgi:hypothetical protein